MKPYNFGYELAQCLRVLGQPKTILLITFLIFYKMLTGA